MDSKITINRLLRFALDFISTRLSNRLQFSQPADIRYMTYNQFNIEDEIRVFVDVVVDNGFDMMIHSHPALEIKLRGRCLAWTEVYSALKGSKSFMFHEDEFHIHCHTPDDELVVLACELFGDYLRVIDIN